MLPNGKRDRGTAVQVILYSIWTVLVSLVPVLGITGKLFLTPVSGVLIGVLGIGLIYYGLRLYKEKTSKAAKQLMLASVTYITLLQIIYVADKFLR
jgi:protoheme IX farnesyltransferase